MEELFNQVDVRQYHATAAVPSQPQLVHRLSAPNERFTPTAPDATHPSVLSVASSSRYRFHLSPSTLPHEKQRTGMICNASSACLLPRANNAPSWTWTNRRGPFRVRPCAVPTASVPFRAAARLLYLESCAHSPSVAIFCAGTRCREMDASSNLTVRTSRHKIRLP